MLIYTGTGTGNVWQEQKDRMLWDTRKCAEKSYLQFQRIYKLDKNGR